MLSQILEIVSKEEFEHYGIRAVHSPSEDVTVSVGDELAPSYRWDDGTPTDEILFGTSAMGVDEDTTQWHIDRFNAEYGVLGRQVALIAGFHAVRGEDLGEIEIKDAVVVAVWDSRVLANV